METRGAARPPDCVRGSRPAPPGSGPHTALPAGHSLPSLSSSGSPQLHRELGGSPSCTPTTRRCQARHPRSTRPAPQMTRPPRDPQTGARSWVRPFASCLVTPQLVSSGHRHPQGPCRYLRSFSRTGSPHVTRDGRPDRVSPQANRRATSTPFRTESFKTSRDGALAGLTQSFLPSSGPLRTWGPLRASRIRGGIPGTPACCPENFSLRLCPDCLFLETGRGRHFPREASGPVRGLLTATSSAGSGACAPGLPGPVRAGAGVFSSRLYNGDSGVACAISE